jgi:hypothetical protein
MSAPVNPCQPNLADYRTFIYGIVLGPRGASAYPSAAGTVSAGTTASLTDISAKWTPNQWVGCVVFDVTQGWGGIVLSNTATEVDFIVSPGGVQVIDSSGAFVTDSSGNQVTATANNAGLAPDAGDQYVIVQAALSESLGMAKCEVNETINCASPLWYTKAVYNLAADRLINFGVDVQGQTLLADFREKFQLLALETGTIGSASDSGTSGSFVVPEQMRQFTFNEIQLQKTPFGRNYMAIAQKYGQSIWAMS